MSMTKLAAALFEAPSGLATPPFASELTVTKPPLITVGPV
jgi:hypothetical protein